jgi:hypothetical protein
MSTSQKPLSLHLFFLSLETVVVRVVPPFVRGKREKRLYISSLKSLEI